MKNIHFFGKTIFSQLVSFIDKTIFVTGQVETSIWQVLQEVWYLAAFGDYAFLFFEWYEIIERAFYGAFSLAEQTGSNLELSLHQND